MTEIVVAQRMWQRRDTPANWTSVNPVLSDGEIGVEKAPTGTVVKLKIGDGVTPWVNLPYFVSGVADNPVQFQLGSDDYLQYSNDGGVTWDDLVPISQIAYTSQPGPAGKNIELRAYNDWIQWRNVGDVNWINLQQVVTVKGDKGDKGDPGLTAYQVAVANGYADTVTAWLASLKGAKGDKGDVGAPGLPTVRRIQVITDTNSGSVACDWSSYDEIRITVTSPLTLTFSGAVDGQGCIIKLRQDATGNHAVTLPTNVRYNGVIPSYFATQGAGKCDKVGFMRDATDNKYDFVSLIPDIA